MARPIKPGIDYFPLDVTPSLEMEFIKIKFGVEGYGIIIMLYSLIYGGRGYYCQWSDDIAMLFAGKNNIDLNKLSAIVEEAVNREIFDSDLFKRYSILTSEEIQRKYILAKRNSKWSITEEYALVDIERKDKSTEVYDGKTPVCDNNKCSNDVEKYTKESKVNKSKINENKGEKINEELHLSPIISPPDVNEVYNFCVKEGCMIDCNKFVNHFNSVGWMINGQPLTDWRSRVRSWYIEDCKKKTAAHRPVQPKGVFNSYNQKQYSQAEISSIEDIIKRRNMELTRGS